MKTVTVAGRCLACWTLNWVEVQIERHLPVAFQCQCRGCEKVHNHALTGQLVPTLPVKALRELKAAFREKRAVHWEQIPLILDLTGPDLAAALEKTSHAPVPVDATARSSHGNGSTQPS